MPRILVLLFAALVTTAQAVGAQHTLDLTKPVARTGETIRSGGGRVIGRSGEKPSRLPLTVTLTSLNRRDFITGEPIVFEIRIRNAGANAIRLPWSPERIAPVNDVTDRKLHLYVFVPGEDGTEYLIAVAALNASTSDDRSFLTLNPGESATVRAPGEFKVIGDPETQAGFEKALPSTFNLKAGLRMMIGPGEWIEPISSANTLPTAVRRRPH